LSAIKETARALVSDLHSVEIAFDDKVKLLERFEELCRRQRRYPVDNTQSRILRYLTLELRLNSMVLQEVPSKLISFTIYHGAIAKHLMNEFSFFSDTPKIIKHAVVASPFNPHKSLSDAKKTAERLAKESKKPNNEFACFAEKPEIFKQAVASNPSNPQQFLRSAFRSIVPNTKSVLERPIFSVVGMNYSLRQ
jgi:hypothetical protein